MYMQQSIVKCESGLYNRQATYFIQKANEFKSSIWVEVEDRKINAKSLLGVLSMGITKGTRVSIIAEGPDEEEARCPHDGTSRACPRAAAFASRSSNCSRSASFGVLRK